MKKPESFRFGFFSPHSTLRNTFTHSTLSDFKIDGNFGKELRVIFLIINNFQFSDT